jgi:hypothetical protein
MLTSPLCPCGHDGLGRPEEGLEGVEVLREVHHLQLPTGLVVEVAVHDDRHTQLQVAMGLPQVVDDLLDVVLDRHDALDHAAGSIEEEDHIDACATTIQALTSISAP